MTSEGCNRRCRGRSRRCCLGCTALYHLEARTVMALECRRNLCLPAAAATTAVVGGRSLVGKHGK